MRKNVSSVRLGQIRLGSVRVFLLLMKCPTEKNPGALMKRCSVGFSLGKWESVGRWM